MKRLLTAIALIAVALYLIWLAPHAVFVGAAVLMSVLCYREYADIIAAHGIRRPDLFGIAAGLLIILWPAHALIGLGILIVVAFTAGLRFTDLSQIATHVACTFFGALYTFAPWRFSIDLRDRSVHLLLFALALSWVGDSAAYYVGRALGKHKLAPRVSPAKSWEGAVASVIASIAFGLLYLGWRVPELPLWSVALMATLGNAAGQLGDLAESAIKRGAGLKDSGDFLPGHGGMLDRVDSSLFALPVVYATYLLIRAFL